MPTLTIAKPNVNEFDPYYGRYIDLIPEAINQIKEQIE